jgi:hypothetical protein
MQERYSVSLGKRQELSLSRDDCRRDHDHIRHEVLSEEPAEGQPVEGPGVRS